MLLETVRTLKVEEIVMILRFWDYKIISKKILKLPLILSSNICLSVCLSVSSFVFLFICLSVGLQ